MGSEIVAIRKAQVEDWQAIGDLLNQLEYPNTELILKGKLEKLVNHPDEELLVYEEDGNILAFISMHYIPQIALKGDFARISYFAVQTLVRSKGIGREMEEYCTNLAIKRNCDRMEVHCHSRRSAAHRFYSRQGYAESPKYFIKMIN